MFHTTSASLTSCGHALDTSPACFGFLRASSDICDDPTSLHARIEQDGYFYLPNFLDRDLVIRARNVMLERLAAEGHLDPAHPASEAVANSASKLQFYAGLSKNNPPLMDLLYAGRMMDFFRLLLGGPVRHFDYTWVRAVSPGHGTPSHCDIVYMGRGTTRLFTAWTPLGDVGFDLGGLMILESSNRNTRLKNTYGRHDVDTYCENRQDHKDAWSRGTNGHLSKNPARIQRTVGGRWLSAEYRAGDLLVFTPYTVHASLDNHSAHIRLSTDTRYQLASDPADERWIGANPIANGPAGKRGRIC